MKFSPGRKSRPHWNLLALFTEHPASVGESYVRHLRSALGFGFRMMLAGSGCLIHGVLPFVCARTGSQCVSKLHSEMTIRGVLSK